MTDDATVPPALQEFGSTGLKRSGGVISEEFLPQLQGIRGQRVFREMADNDPIVGGAMLALTEIITRLDWKVEPPENPTPEETDQARFVQECLDDMSESWDTTLGQALSFLIYGWSYHEIVYKVRGGRAAEPTHRSRYNDGRIGWRKFAVRGQDTLTRWVFDKKGGLRGMVQQDSTAGVNATIPIERALLFRVSEYKGNPEGRSMLRNAYRPWWYKKRIEEIEAIGIERDLAGLPLAYAPMEYFQQGADPALLNSVVDAVKNARRNEAEGLVFPSVFDEDGNRLLTFELVTSGGSRQIDTDKVIQRYNNGIATSMLQDFLTLGHEGVGSYSLGAAKITMWQLVVDSIAKSVAEVINQHAIPRLMRLNGWMPDRTPELKYGDVSRADLAVLSDFLQRMIDSGVIVPDPALETYLRDLAGVPAAEGAGRAFDDETRIAGPAAGPTSPATPSNEPAPAATPAPAPTEPQAGA
jgi:hypothetical protein